MIGMKAVIPYKQNLINRGLVGRLKMQSDSERSHSVPGVSFENTDTKSLHKRARTLCTKVHKR